MRVIRILVYEGDPVRIDKTMRMNAVKKYHEINGLHIYEEVIGYTYPTQVEVPDSDHTT